MPTSPVTALTVAWGRTTMSSINVTASMKDHGPVRIDITLRNNSSILHTVPMVSSRSGTTVLTARKVMVVRAAPVHRVTADRVHTVATARKAITVRLADMAATASVDRAVRNTRPAAARTPAV